MGDGLEQQTPVHEVGAGEIAYGVKGLAIHPDKPGTHMVERENGILQIAL